MPMKKIAAIVSLFVASAAMAQQSDWIVIAGRTLDNGTPYVVSGRKNSGGFTKTRSGEMIYAVMFRVETGNQTEYEKKYVRITDCDAGAGVVVSTNMTGKFLYENQAMLDGSGRTIADSIGVAICDAARSHVEALQKEQKARNDKSI